MASPKNDIATDSISFKNLRRLYLFALLTIALTVLVSQFILQYNLNRQLSDSKIINTSGKQRMLSQKLTKELLILHFITDSSKIDIEKNRIDSILVKWKFNHEALVYGNEKLGFPKEKSTLLNELYQSIQPNFEAMILASQQYLQSKNSVANTEKHQKLLGLVLANERIFLTKMNQIVEQYDQEALEKVTLQSKTEYGILLFTLLVLVLEFLFIFKPTNKKIEMLVSKLLTSERKALKLAYNTEVLSEIKENSVKELKSLNYAMENTLLYCRVAPNGILIHIGEKFSKLLHYNRSQTNQRFSQVLTAIEKEQSAIDSIIAEKHRSGWQGEITFTNKEGHTIWLDLSMIPVTIKKGLPNC
jgi:hypothetical protein